MQELLRAYIFHCFIFVLAFLAVITAATKATQCYFMLIKTMSKGAHAHGNIVAAAFVHLYVCVCMCVVVCVGQLINNNNEKLVNGKASAK